MSIKDKNTAFTGSLFALIAVLASICALFLFLSASQGPRLRHVELDRARVTQQPSQRLTLYANQPITGVGTQQVSITPKVSITASTNGEAVMVQFNERLRYGTTYHITVHNVRSTYRTQRPAATFTYTFKTADPVLYYLHRNYGPNPLDPLANKKSDQIIQTTLSGSKKTAIFTAPQIQEYVIIGNKLAVVTVNKDATNSLYVVSLGSNHAEKLSLPASGTIVQLRASPNQRLIGFSFSSNEKDATKRTENILFNMDLAAGRSMYPVLGLRDQKLQVSDWQFAPDGTTILAQTYDTSLLLIDTNAKHTPMPLGQFKRFGNFSYNGATVVADDVIGPKIIDILKHTQIAITNRPIGSVTDPFTETIRLLADGPGFVKQVEVLNSDQTTFTHYLILDRAGNQKTLYQTPDTTSNVDNIATSPNDQVLTAEISKLSSSPYDQYPSNAKLTNTHTLLLDTASGKVLKDVDGVDVLWP